VRQWGLRAKIDPVLVLDAKGEKIRPKQDMDQLPLENFEKVELEFLFVKILLCVPYCQVDLLGRRLYYGKEGEFFLKSLINFSWNNSCYVSTSVFDLEIGN
jgi:hypothetical protein